MRLSMLAGTVLFAVSSAAMASGLQFQLSNRSAQLSLLTNSSIAGYSGAQLDFSGFVNNHSDVLGSAGMMVQGLPAGQSPLTFGLGAKAYAGKIDSPNKNVEAIAIGGLAKYTIPYHMPMAVVAKGFYAPNITTFSDGKSLTDLNLNYQIEVTPGATAFAGYRLLQTNLKNHGEYSLDDSVHIGIRLHF